MTDMGKLSDKEWDKKYGTSGIYSRKGVSTSVHREVDKNTVFKVKPICSVASARG